MPRPSRCRRVCCEPQVRRFAPEAKSAAGVVVLFVEEYEAVRLIDLQKRTHDQCARQMDISRTTVTEIYEKARFKIADALVNGKALVVEGGNYRVCQEPKQCECRGRCPDKALAQSATQGTAGVFQMKVAVPFKNDNVFGHFGMAPAFRIYTLDDKGIVGAELVPAGGHGHGAMVNLLVKNGVDTVICGGLGGGAVQALFDAGIRLYAGVKGSADEAVQALIAGTLTSDIEAATAGRGHHHGHGEGGCGCHGHGDREEGCGCHGHGEEGCGCHGHGEEGCGCHGHGLGEEGCGCHGHGHEEGGCGCGCHDDKHEEKGCGCGGRGHGHGHGHGHGSCGCC